MRILLPMLQRLYSGSEGVGEVKQTQSISRIHFELTYI